MVLRTFQEKGTVFIVLLIVAKQVCASLYLQQKTVVVVTSQLSLNITEVHFTMHLGRKTLGSCITRTWYPATLFREALGSTNLVPSGLPFLGHSPRHYPI